MKINWSEDFLFILVILLITFLCLAGIVFGVWVNMDDDEVKKVRTEQNYINFTYNGPADGTVVCWSNVTEKSERF